LRATRPGRLHGLCGGIFTTLAERIEISNLPGDPGTSNFAHAFLPIDTPVEVMPGDPIDVQIDSFDGDELRWIVTVTPSVGYTRRFTQSTFLSRTLTHEALRKHDPSYRPALSVRGQMERDLLAQIDGARTLGELREWFLAHGGAQLTQPRLAELLAATIERCG